MGEEIISMIKSLENTMNERLNRQDEMLGQLIKMAVDNNARLERIENAVNHI
ncbi:hypothetical protein [Schinkia azotoformans]|uniref:hypothetical protein n=1 Tax=Schinkia azotoformans TaxID=1454 RepID=UPI002DBD8AF6|nr:hypothetical protein [Schinkia azotoformans]MEC1771976.1 hypothetical protein [Schinkia azotoformans]MED4366474.1 hypothetical protein [Schinkia azotoformans]